MRRLLAAVALVGNLLVLGTPARATLPGPNGRILYRGNGLTTMDADGRNKLTVAAEGIWGGWSPMGAKIAFTKNDSGLWTMDADGTDKVAVILQPGIYRSPSWSPDGTLIAFASTMDDPHPRSCFPCNSEIYTIAPDGTGLTRLTFTPGLEETLEWAPDGSRIAFSRVSEGLQHSGIWVMKANGTGARAVNSNLHGFYPTWSPDGTRIAFTGAPSRQGLPQIYVMNADGTDVHDVSTPGVFSQQPSWSPDGTQIAFIHAQTPAGVWVMNADGSNQHTLTPGAGDLFTPRWGSGA
jgi:Tol biopolymer transport system component